MKLVTLITTILAVATLNIHASTIEAFDVTSALSAQFKSDHQNKDGLYTFCGILTSNQIKDSFLKAPLKQKDATTVIFSNGATCSINRISDPISGVADFQVKVSGEDYGKMNSTISAMKDQGLIIFSGVGRDKASPKFYLIKINEV